MSAADFDARHLYDGDCPDYYQPDARDPACPACVALIVGADQRATLTRALVAQLWAVGCAIYTEMHRCQENEYGDIGSREWSVYGPGLIDAGRVLDPLPAPADLAAEILGGEP